MNNLNSSQNSNNLNDSSKTKDKLYSNDPSLDDILTYSDDISQNQSCNKSLSKQNIYKKDEKQNEGKPPIINSFNSEIAMSFLNNDKERTKHMKNLDYNNYSKSALKPLYRKDALYLNDYKNNNLYKSCNNDFKSLHFISFIKSENDPFDENIVNNFKDVSGFHASISNIFSEFEIKDISISKSNNDIKKNNSEKEIQKSNNNIEPNNKNQNSEEHSNTNSMCNYQNNSNSNENINNNNKNENLKLDNNKKDLNEKSKKEMLSSDDIGEIKIKLNISLDDCNNKKYNNDKTNNYLDEIIDENEINKKEIFSTSNKKESNSFYAQIAKQNKNSLKYTKAQCVQPLFQNNEKQENKQYILSDAPIKTKDTTSDKKKTKKIISLSPHKLSFEIQKNDCIQISYNNKKNNNNTINNELNNNISSINNNTSELSISKVEDMNIDNNYFYKNESLIQNNTTSFTISPNIKGINKFIHRKISYQKNNNIRNKKIYINNRNIDIQKEDSNNFFYNPNNNVSSGPIISNISNNKTIQNELQTPDLNKNKITPMTCVHKGSLIYYNDTNNNGNNNTIKYNCSNNNSFYVKGNINVNNNVNNNINNKKRILNNQTKLVYLKSKLNKSKNKNIRSNKENIEINGKLKQVTIINNKNRSIIKINNNKNNSFNKINKNQEKRNNSKINGKQLIRKQKFSQINNNTKIKDPLQKNLTIKNIINNNNSIKSNNNRRIIRGINKIKMKVKSNSNSIINKINNEAIKESSLFHILYNMPTKNKSTTKNNSGASSKDEKELTIIQKNSPKENQKEKEKENTRKVSQKRKIKHNSNNSFSLYNSFYEKILDDSKKKNMSKAASKDKSKNKYDNEKKMTNQKSNRSHKKINSLINLDALTSNFNFNNIDIMKRRKNNKSVYNFGNIFFINQNHIIKNEPEPSNSNVIKYINKNIKIKSKNKIENIDKRYGNNMNELEAISNRSKNQNKLTVSTKQNPEKINDFSKYRKKKEIVVKNRKGLDNNKIYSKQEYKETQLISEN